MYPKTLFATLVVVLATGCAGAQPSAPAKLTIGIKFDQPGVGLKGPDGSFTGMDVDIARYVAGRLGADVTFVEARSANREALLEQREVDLVVAAYSITEERKEWVDFAGPYFLAGQSMLVRKKNSDITGPRSLDDRDWGLCSVTGSTSAEKVKQHFAGNVTLREFPTYGDCVAALLGGAVDAVTTDDVVLAGFTAVRPDKLKVVGEPFSTERYGIGLHKGDPRQAEVTSALRQLVSDGTWQRVAEANLGRSGYRIPVPPIVLDRP